MEKYCKDCKHYGKDFGSCCADLPVWVEKLLQRNDVFDIECERKDKSAEGCNLYEEWK